MLCWQFPAKSSTPYSDKVALQTPNDKAFQPMTTIITGGTGFIGGNFIHYYMKSHPALYMHPLSWRLAASGNIQKAAESLKEIRGIKRQGGPAHMWLFN